jgi:hypothetical protein
LIKSLNYYDKSGEALQLAEKFAQEVEREKQAASQLVPGIAERLLSEIKLIEPHEKQAAVDQLNDHAGTLKVMGNLITVMGQMKAAYEQKLAVNPGQAVADSAGNQKQASEQRNNNPNYVGRRTGAGEKSAADRVFFEKLGIGHLVGQ